MNSKKLSQTNRYFFFKEIISFLDQAGVLSDLILIGGWCLHVYREYFKNEPQIPLLRTADIDFLIPRPLRIKNKIDVHALLQYAGFDVRFSQISGHIKYVHPQLEIEFLTPELGKGSNKPFVIKSLNLNAQQLRYLTLLQNHAMEVIFSKSRLTVPEPSAYVLHKFLLSVKRQKPDKREKDLQTAVELGAFLLGQEKQRTRMREIFQSLPKSWKTVILSVIEKEASELSALLK